MIQPMPHISQPGPSRFKRGVHYLIEHYPSLTALLLLVALWGMPKVLLLLLQLVLPMANVSSLSLTAREVLGEAILVLEVVVVISWLGWWPVLGFTGGKVGKTLALYIVPFILIVLVSLLSLASNLAKIPAMPLVMVVTTCLMIGFVEEVCFRGIMLHMLMPRRGIIYAVLFSSVLFGCFHSINLLQGFPYLYVLGEAILGVGIGVLFAALRLRSNSIWPVLILHAIRDLPGLVLLYINPHQVLNATPVGIIAISVYSFLFVLYALFLLRPKQLAKLRIDYGLVPAPAPEVPQQNLYPG